MKQLGEKVLGWFVVTEEEDAPVVEAPEPKPATLPPRIDHANDDVRKVIELIASLPDGAPLEVKRAIVVASLEAFGIRIDAVLASVAQAEHALENRASQLTNKIAETKERLTRELAEQEEAAKVVARQRAHLKAVGAFFGKSGV